ncbi:hypothetical protein HHK36_023997 [Tetracentron sinense]|uniref:Uncharacterized protein n=1 Tax=Tetracentron sinense TaxID=13715 RepID=A0A834YS52_TETSI|nr:hypothetical protein HHK36_023997 [Tetracentron sinense]
MLAFAGKKRELYMGHLPCCSMSCCTDGVSALVSPYYSCCDGPAPLLGFLPSSYLAAMIKADTANISRVCLHQALADSEAEFTHLLLSLDERSIPGREPLGTQPLLPALQMGKCSIRPTTASRARLLKEKMRTKLAAIIASGEFTVKQSRSKGEPISIQWSHWVFMFSQMQSWTLPHIRLSAWVRISRKCTVVAVCDAYYTANVGYAKKIANVWTKLYVEETSEYAKKTS